MHIPSELAIAALHQVHVRPYMLLPTHLPIDSCDQCELLAEKVIRVLHLEYYPRISHLAAYASNR